VCQWRRDNCRVICLLPPPPPPPSHTHTHKLLYIIASMAEAARLVPSDAKIVAPPSAGGVLERYVRASHGTKVSVSASVSVSVCQCGMDKRPKNRARNRSADAHCPSNRSVCIDPVPPRISHTRFSIDRYFPASRIIYLSPGQSAELKGRKDGKARVKVRAGEGGRQRRRRRRRRR
jgi:hypothetical protein